jgi:hypothetical protein
MSNYKVIDKDLCQIEVSKEKCEDFYHRIKRDYSTYGIEGTLP